MRWELEAVPASILARLAHSSGYFTCLLIPVEAQSIRLSSSDSISEDGPLNMAPNSILGVSWATLQLEKS
jgi:hypothetical protein